MWPASVVAHQGDLRWAARHHSAHPAFFSDLVLREDCRDLRHEAAVLCPNRIRGMSERMIISHYENNCGGAVKRLNLIRRGLPNSTVRARVAS